MNGEPTTRPIAEPFARTLTAFDRDGVFLGRAEYRLDYGGAWLVSSRRDGRDRWAKVGTEDEARRVLRAWGAAEIRT